jgi:hypothetical protein
METQQCVLCIVELHVTVNNTQILKAFFEDATMRYLRLLKPNIAVNNIKLCLGFAMETQQWVSFAFF